MAQHRLANTRRRFQQTLRAAYTGPLSKVPGPWYAHLTNLPLKAAVISGNRMYFLHALHQRYGALVRVSPHEVSACDPDAYRTIFNARNGFPKADWYKKIAFSDRPVIFAIPDNKSYAVRRRLFAKGFQKTLLRTDWEEGIAGFAKLAVQRIKEEALADGVADVYKWWAYLAADVAGMIMFGSRTGFGMVKSGKKNEFIRCVGLRMMGEGIAVELPFVRTIEPYIPSQSFHELFGGKEIVAKHAKKAVENAKSDTSQNVFTRIREEAERGDPLLTDEDVANEATNLTIAGSDTTGITLTYLVWAVLKHPTTAQAALEAEVGALDDSDLTDDALEKLPVLNAIIQETLRLYSAAPGSLPRAVPPGGASLCGYTVPEGTIVSAQAWSMHRLPELWGSDADEFDYTRWLPENEERISETARATFAAWGGTPRVCLGIHMANMVMRLAVAMFFRECKGAKLAPEMNDAMMECENYFLITPKGHKCLIAL